MMRLTSLLASDCGGFPSKWYCTPGGQHIAFTNLGDVVTVLANIIRILLQFAGALAVLFIIFGGVLYVTSTGDPGRIGRAKNTISQAILGLVICIAAYGVVTFIASRF